MDHHSQVTEHHDHHHEGNECQKVGIFFLFVAIVLILISINS